MESLIQNKKIKKIRQQIMFFLSCCMVISCYMISCSDMTDDYKKYLEGGEIIYPAKADSLETHSGKYRIELQWLLLSDPSITSATAYWNAGRDSQTTFINRTPGAIDTIKMIINDLDEGLYTFEIYTFNADGDKSVSAEVIGTVYGDKYEASLLTEPYLLFYDMEKGAGITWKSETENVIGNEINYTSNTGETVALFVKKGDTIFSLPNFDRTNSVSFRTAYLPPNAIDTFYTNFSPIDLSEIVNIAVNKPVAASSFSAYPPENAVDGNNATTTANRFITSSVILYGPQWISVDLEKELPISSVKLYCQSAFRAFQLQKEMGENNWEDIIVETENAIVTYTATLSETPARKIRLYVTEVTGSDLVRLYEIEIYVEFIYLL